MKKIIILVIVVLLAVFLYPKSYISSPGHVSAERAEEFYRTAQKCIGYSYLTNAMQVASDSPGQSRCYGWLI